MTLARTDVDVNSVPGVVASSVKVVITNEERIEMDDVKSGEGFVTVGSVKMPRSDFYAMVEKADKKSFCSFNLVIVEMFAGVALIALLGILFGGWCLLPVIPFIAIGVATYKMGTRDLNLLSATNYEDVRDFFLYKGNKEVLKRTAKAESLARRSLGEGVKEPVAGEGGTVDSVTIGDDVAIDGGDDIVAVVNR